MTNTLVQSLVRVMWHVHTLVPKKLQLSSGFVWQIFVPAGKDLCWAF